MRTWGPPCTLGASQEPLRIRKRTLAAHLFTTSTLLIRLLIRILIRILIYKLIRLSAIFYWLALYLPTDPIPFPFNPAYPTFTMPTYSICSVLPTLPTLPHLLPRPIYILYIRIRSTNSTYLYDLRTLPRLAKAANLWLPPSLCSASLNLDLSPCGLRHQGSDHHFSVSALFTYTYYVYIYVYVLRISICISFSILILSRFLEN